MPTGVDSIEAQIIGRVIGDGLLKVKVDRGETFLCVTKSALRQTIETLKSHPELGYDYFAECLGVDYSTWPHERDFAERFEVIYNLMSVGRATRIFVKVGVNDGETVPTVKDIFLGAEYPEWEIWDLLGITFSGNERRERFLLPEDWVGFPLRKEFPLGGEDVVFHGGTEGPAVEDIQMPHAGESFEGKTGSEGVSGR
ncbi:MAG: NADH-quinone oxidoreductase subunit C [Fimbriimonadaceae bacterium]|nr:NADH-quinone oxidoreductase subunit C [Fimbriimonadaceae bacterium]